MTRTNKTRSALFTSIISLLLCVSMLVGTTFAWFTDTASTGVNTIQSGNLDLVLEYRNDKGEWVEVDEETHLFDDEALYEPGYTEVAYLRVRNNGSLALKYILTVNVADEVAGVNQAGESFNLSDHIQFGTVTTEVGETIEPYADREAAQAAVKDSAKKLQSYTTDGYVALAPGEAIEMALVVFMPTTVGNEANHNGVNKPSITMGVKVFATQLNSEEDSFGPDYDLNAPTVITVGEDTTVYTTLNEAIAAAKTAGADTIKVAGPAKYDFGTASNQNVDLSGMTIQGEGNAVVIFEGDGANNTLVGVTLKDLTVLDETTSYNESSWELGYLELANVTAENVVFENGIMIDGVSTFATEYNSSFTNCTFVGKTDGGLKMYGAWVNSGSALFSNCTFTGTRGLKVHEAYGSEVSVITVENCTFKNLTEKPGVALGTLNAETTIAINKCTFTNVQPGDQGMYIYESDTDVSAFDFTINGESFITNQAAFEKAISEKKETITLLPGNYKMVNTNYDVTIIGSSDVVMTVTHATGNNNKITFKGISIVGETTEDDWQNVYTLAHAGSVAYEDCTIEGLITAYVPSSFTNCEFNNNTRDQYSVFCYGAGEHSFTNCTFNTATDEGKAIKLYNHADMEATLTVTNCTFNASKNAGEEQKAAVEIDSRQNTTSMYTVKIAGCKLNENYTKLWAAKGTKVVVYIDGIEYVAEGLGKDAEGTYLVSSAVGLVNFEKLVNNGNKTFSGETVKLTADIDMTGINWNPITQTGSTAFVGTFDGQGYTISNLTIDDEGKTVMSNGENVYSVGLFGFLEGGATIKNIKIDGAKVSGHHNVGVIAGYISNSVTIENCDVTNATVLCTHTAADTCGDKAGVIVGIVGAANCYVKDCDVSNSTVTAGRDAGQIIGSWTELKNNTELFSDCTAQNVKVTATGDCEREGNISNAPIGRLS